ncbi:MAG TPA: hypothetical protein VGJ60_21415 [Chloroflexota bacterium]
MRRRLTEDFSLVRLHRGAERGGLCALQSQGFNQETHGYQPRGGLYPALQVADGPLTQPSTFREFLLRQPAREPLTAQDLSKKRAHGGVS